ncbi:MAG: hypothetical protein K0S76_2725 [Herbinix sp.]|jgi:hypothetical protein|nr:hypothetical protein [Herbinix sp.]
MEKVTLNFQYSKKEYIDAFRLYLFQSKIIRKFDFILIGILSMIEVLLLLWSGISIYSIVTGIILGFYCLLFTIMYYYQPGNVYKHNPKLRQTYQLIFFPDKILFKTNGVSSDLKWDIYHEILSSDRFYFLIQSKQVFTILPKRALTNKSDVKNFEKMIAHNHITLKNFA